MREEIFLNEKHLLLQISTGDERAFIQLFNAYRDKLYSYVLTITQSKEFAEDTVHDVFLKIWTMGDKLVQIENIESYLRKMARNHALNGIRKLATQTLVFAELQRRPNDEVYNPADELVWKEVRDFVHQSVNNLTPQQREIFRLNREQGLKLEEIAAKLNISIFTVKKHLADARHLLKQALSNNYGLELLVCGLLLRHFF